jgi:hypothetical protein
MRLKLIMIVTFQDKALATKRHEMRDGQLASKAEVKGSQNEDQVQEDSISDMTCSVNCINLKASRSSMLIEHHPSHLN